ncbi:MAG: DNA translocase FtsK, partial [Clostridia bacterium]|nr:DNA translocase FtsK [Clostridia bacterium]
MATKKKRNVTTAKNAKSSSTRQLKAVLLFALAVFLMFVVFIPGEAFWNSIHNVMFGVFGITAYFYPFLLGTVAVVLAMERENVKKIITKTVEVAILVLLIGTVVDVFTAAKTDVGFFDYIVSSYSVGVTLKNGGFISAVFGFLFRIVLGDLGAKITLIILIFVTLMITTGTTLIALFKGIAKPVKVVSTQAGNVYQEHIRVNEEKAKDGKELKVIKGFNVDIPVDDIPKTRAKKQLSLNEHQKNLIDAYYDGDEDKPAEFTEYTDISSVSVDKALDAADSEAEEKTPITVDFEKETEEVAEEIESTEVIKNYKYPPIDLLKISNSHTSKSANDELESTAERLVEVLKSFGVETRVVDISRGPTVTRYELQPCAGVKISKITNLADDIALNLAAAGVRIEAPIPNKAAVGIEVPNKASAVVGVREIIESTAFTASKSKLTVALGKDIGGNVVVTDIAKMPHGLIAGATGSGKSVCINSIITSILYKASPDEVKLLMIDPKVVELGVYNGIPHLLVPVVTEPRKAAGALGWAVSEMEKRYQMFADRCVRDIEGYNRVVDTLVDEPEVKRMPHIVIIIDELADLMMTAPKEVEDSINRIAAKARAAGMHLIIATQRPSVNVVTGVIKANIPTRIAFAVSSHIDSATILDCAGAEKLLGKGDMLFNPVGSVKPKRLQGCFVSDTEVESVVNFVKNSANAEYDDNIMVEIEHNAAVEKQARTGLEEDAPDEDPMLEEAIKIVVESGQASTSLL